MTDIKTICKDCGDEIIVWDFHPRFIGHCLGCASAKTKDQTEEKEMNDEGELLVGVVNGDLLIRTVEAVKETFGAKDDDYITVFITVLIGKEEDVLEAETTIDSRVDQDDLPCKSAVIKLSDWIGEVEEE